MQERDHAAIGQRFRLLWLAILCLVFSGCASVGDKADSGQTPKNIVIVFADGTAAT